MAFIRRSLSAALLLVSPFAFAVDAKPTETATFAAGCFWGTEDYFNRVPGVVQTKVGYAGGESKDPTYGDVAHGKTGHAESVEIRFDPKKISYENLLDLFFKMHDPTTPGRQGNDVGPQYRSAIFTANAAQQRAADAFKAKVEKSGAWKKSVSTEIKPAGHFYPAEEEHQNYLRKHAGGYDNHFVRESMSFDAP